MKQLLAVILIGGAFCGCASAGECTTKIMATSGGDQQSLDVHQIEVRKDGVTVLEEKASAIRTTGLECGKIYTALIRKMGKNSRGDYTKFIKTRTRTFVSTKSSRVFINMDD